MDAISYLILDLKPGTMKKYKNVALSVCLISCSLYAVLVDYVHPTAIRLIVQIAVITALLFYLVWTAEILWS